MTVIDKPWGCEVVLCNEPEYCAKKLCLGGGKQSSLHFHRTKKETFVVTQGEVALERDGRCEILHPGETRVIPPLTMHRFGSTLSAEILEISMHHEDSDVYRLEPGGDFTFANQKTDD